MNALVAAFVGDVTASLLGGDMLRLQGHARDDGTRLTLWFSACKSSVLPTLLRDAAVYEERDAGMMQWRISAAGVDQAVHARSVQVHREPGADWMQAVAPPTASLQGRVGWALLLNVLRIPGVGRLLRMLRAS